jgi:hypothetical protein
LKSKKISLNKIDVGLKPNVRAHLIQHGHGICMVLDFLQNNFLDYKKLFFASYFGLGFKFVIK